MNRQFVPDETEKFQPPHWLNGRLSKKQTNRIETIRYTKIYYSDFLLKTTRQTYRELTRTVIHI